jgi:sulfate transport system permease protein
MASELAPSTIDLTEDRSRSSLGQTLLTLVVLGWLSVLLLGPTVALLSRAFGGGFESFFTAAASAQAQHAFVLTLGLTVVTTLVNVVFGVLIAIVLVRHRFPGKTIVDGLVDMPFAVSPIVAGLMLVVLFGPEGWLGRWLDARGFQVVYSWPGMILACLFVTVPLVAREVVPVLREFGVDQEEVAFTLGANRMKTFWRVTLPSIRWGLAYGIALTVARSLGEFGALLVVSGNILGRTQTATLFVHDQIESFRPEGAYAASVVLAGISFALILGMELLRKHVARHERSPGA